MFESTYLQGSGRAGPELDPDVGLDFHSGINRAPHRYSGKCLCFILIQVLLIAFIG